MILKINLKIRKPEQYMEKALKSNFNKLSSKQIMKYKQILQNGNKILKI